MKILHISDLHIGRTLYDYSLIEEQKFALDRIIEIINLKNIDVLLVCGDIYDKANPSDEALNLVDEFVYKLSRIDGLKTIIISGNHDNDDKLKYLSSFLQKYNIFIYTSLEDLKDELIIDGVSFLPIPYLNLSVIRSYYKDSTLDIVSGHKRIIDEYFTLSKATKHICLCHNFISGSKSVSSERTISVGGIEDLPKILFEKFDYTALGHLHTPQNLDEKIRYSGSLLKYSEDEVNNKIGCNLIDLETGDIERIPYLIKRDIKKIEGTYQEIISKFSPGQVDDSFVFITLCGDDRPIDAHIKLKHYYPYLCRISIKENEGDLMIDKEILSSDSLLTKSTGEVFEIFYQKQYGKTMTPEELEVLNSILEDGKGE